VPTGACKRYDPVLALDHEVTYQLADDSTQNSVPPPDFNSLIQTGLAQRPDLQPLTFGQQSAKKFARAQWDQMLPSVTATEAKLVRFRSVWISNI
jgi:outer membrane protein